MSQPSSMELAAHQFPQYHFARSVVTSSSLDQPSYLTLLAAYPLPKPAQEALSLLSPLPSVISRSAASHSLLAAVSSEPSIKLYNYSHANGALEHFQHLRGHTRPIHDIKFHNVHSSYDTANVETANGACMLSSASEDGTVKFWDVRQEQPAITFKHPKNKPFFACASSGNLLAAGSGPFFFLWDLRSQKLLAQNEEFHTEDINQIAFHPFQTTTFFTGAEDGLICEIKPEDPDQDEWLQNVINIENPVSRFGFFGPKAEYIWALSCVETLSLWHIEECDRISDFAQIRDHMTKAANMPIDYLIDAHYDQKSQRVFLATGCNTGELILSHVNKADIQPFCLGHVVNKPKPAASEAGSDAATNMISPVTGFSLEPLKDSPFAMSALTAIQQPAASSADASMEDDTDDSAADFLKDGEVIMNGGNGDDSAMKDSDGQAAEEPARPPIDPTAEGHTATIRDVVWFGSQLITAGEDSRLCLWTTEPTRNNVTPASSSSFKVKQHAPKADSASNGSQPMTGKGNRHSPY